jgi:nitrogen PTS system EIIA component
LVFDVESPIDLANYLSLDRTVCGLETTSRKRLFEQLARLLAVGLVAQDEKHIFRTLVDREKLGSTGVGDGIAIPHGRIEGLPEPRIAVVQLAEPVEYGARDKKPINLALALLVPEDATEAHLQLLSMLAQRVSDHDIRHKLDAADTAQQLIGSLVGPAFTRVM